MIKNTDLAYFAGYIDGDGCFHLGYSKNKFINSLIISSVNKEVLYYFKKLFKGSIHTKTKILPGHKQLYYYTLKKHNAYSITIKIKSYLVEKQGEAITFIKFIETRDKILIDNIKIIKNKSNRVLKEHKKEFEKVKNTIKPTIEDFAYLAGFIDAECCFNINKYKPKNNINYVYKIQLSLNNTKAPVFKWLLERFGGSINFIDRSHLGINHNNQYQWRLNGKALSKILNYVYPFLKHKKPICGELIKFYKTTFSNGGDRQSEQFKIKYATVIKTREKIITKIHKLNLKGNIKYT